MMHSTGEQTPLLGGIDRGPMPSTAAAANATTTRRRPRSFNSREFFYESEDLTTETEETTTVEENDTGSNTGSMYSQVEIGGDQISHSNSNSRGNSNNNYQNSHQHQYHQRRSNNNNNNNAQYETGSTNSVSSDSDDLQKKADRRSWSQRLVATMNQSIQKGAYACLPAIKDDDTYEDTFNDQPWQWTFGTHEDDGVWMNTTDRAGTLMAVTVWLLILYSAVTIFILTASRHVSQLSAATYATISCLALACHAKTTFTDPGAVVSAAVPLVTKGVKFHPMCSICHSFKPRFAHHCRICNRCVTRMDHHCPWMNNCVGAGNLKHFALFLMYTWLGSAMAMTLFLLNYFFCSSANCEFTTVEIQLVRVMSVICFGAWLFTSSMLMSVVYGAITGVGTIDRLKKKANNSWHLSDEEAVPLSHIFGSGPIWTWFLPLDPFFPDYDQVMGYATPQRLLREHSSSGRETTTTASNNQRQRRKSLSQVGEV